MYNIIQKFLALHHYVDLPGIGSFTVEKNPASIDFTSRNINASENIIVFSNNDQQPEKSFYDFLSAELHTDQAHAAHIFTTFTEKLKYELNNNKPVYFKGIGSITQQTPSVFSFEAEATPGYFPELTAERVIRKNTIHTVKVGEDEKTSDEMHAVLAQPQIRKKEKWWVAATILGFIGIAAIAIYYLFYA